MLKLFLSTAIVAASMGVAHANFVSLDGCNRTTGAGCGRTESGWDRDGDMPIDVFYAIEAKCKTTKHSGYATACVRAEIRKWLDERKSSDGARATNNDAIGVP
jgi:hypothetical protein